MVADDHVAVLVDDVAAPSTELTTECKRSLTESVVSPFNDADCLDDPAAEHEYAEDERCEESLRMMGDVESYEERSMMPVDQVSVVCSQQTEEPQCCNTEQLSSTHEHILEQNGQQLFCSVIAEELRQ